MDKSAFWLAAACIILAAATGFLFWRLMLKPAAAPVAQSGGSVIPLGLPAVQSARDETFFKAQSIILWDTNTQTIRYQHNAFQRHPLASLTKLMTAMVALDYGIAWDTPVTIMPEEYVQGGQLLLHSGETVTMRNLFIASLLGSANNATLAYVRSLGLPKKEFIQAMNRKAIELGLEQTEFHDVTGLDSNNISTAYEVARLADVAFSKYPDITAATSRPEYAFTVGGSGRQHVIRNTNKLISVEGEPASGSKTGYLYEAKYCLVMAGAGEWGDRIGVILGSESEERSFLDMKALLHLDVP